MNESAPTNPTIARPGPAELTSASVTPGTPTTPERGDDLLRLAYFETLRREILQVKARLVGLIVVGLVGVPILTWFALSDDSLVKLPLVMSPLLVLLLIVVYFSEQTSMMRAGQYIHERVESGDQHWEHWVNELRTRHAEPQIFGLLVVMGLAYSFLMASFAIESMRDVDPAEHSYFIYYVLRYAVPGIYALSFLWAFVTLAAFWRRAFKVSAK